MGWGINPVVVGLGAVLGVLGPLEPDLYVIGLLILIIGGVVVLVRAADWIRWLRGLRAKGVEPLSPTCLHEGCGTGFRRRPVDGGPRLVE